MSLDTTIINAKPKRPLRNKGGEISGSIVEVQALHQRETTHSSSRQEASHLPLRRRDTSRFPPHQQDTSRLPSSKTCQGCGSRLHPGGRQQCPAPSLTCHSCHKIGHLARVCRGRATYAAMALHVESPSGEEVREVNASKTEGREFEPAPRIEVHISSLMVKPLSRCCLIRERTYLLLVHLY